MEDPVHQITREVWSQLSPRERDTMATKLIKPFQETDDPDGNTATNECLQWVHLKDGILISRPYGLHAQSPLRVNGAQFAHTWRKFCPTTDMNDALTLVERDFIMVVIVRTQDNAWVASLFNRHSMQSGVGRASTIAELPAALTFAAVVSASQPGSIPA
jgi:hypothetical protein